MAVCLDVCGVLESNRRYVNTQPYCEPALGRRGLYRSTGGDGIDSGNLARLWVLNLSDGRHSLLDIAERSGIACATLAGVARELVDHGLLLEPPPSS